MSARRPRVDPDDDPWSPVTRTRGGTGDWSTVTRSDDRWSDDPVGWAMPLVCARHLRRAGAWMGAVAALGGALVSLVLVVAIWLLQAATTGSPTAAMRAGVLLFLAAQHGGITLDGDTVRFLPLGLLALATVLPWRAGRSLAAVADDRGERSALRPAFARLVLGYVVACFVLALVGRVGTSHAEFLTTLGASLLLVVVAGGVGARRELCLRDETPFVPARCQPVGRAVGSAALVGAASSALLIAVSVAVHAGRVAELSRAIGGGIAGLPVLVLGIVAAPNAVVATSSLLAGPGFAVGTDTVLDVGGSRHGLLPSVPLLGALPDGAGVHPLVVVWAAVTFVLIGLVVARTLGRAPSVRDAVRRHLAVGVLAAGLMAVAAALAGGGLGTGRLRAVGASPWQAGLAFGGEVLVAGALVTLVRAAARLVRVADDELGATAGVVTVTPAAVTVVARSASVDDAADVAVPVEDEHEQEDEDEDEDEHEHEHEDEDEHEDGVEHEDEDEDEDEDEVEHEDGDAGSETADLSDEGTVTDAAPDVAPAPEDLPRTG